MLGKYTLQIKDKNFNAWRHTHDNDSTITLKSYADTYSPRNDCRIMDEAGSIVVSRSSDGTWINQPTGA